MSVHPRLQELLSARPGSDSAESIAKRTAAAVRSSALEIRELQRPPAALHAVWDVAPASASGVGARVYRPHDGPAPVIVYFHGGGFVIDGAGHDAPLRDLAAATRCTIVAPDVRLAPEHRFPAALDDLRQFTRWVHDVAAVELGGSSKVGIAGDSSGGNLAANVTRELTRAGCRIGFQVLVYPMLDATAQSASYEEFGTGYGFTHAKSRWYYDQYLPSGADLRDPLISPIFGGDFEGLPRTLVVTAECDPLRDDGETYARMIRTAGGRASVKRYEGMIHGFFQMTALDAALEAQRDIATWIHEEPSE